MGQIRVPKNSRVKREKPRLESCPKCNPSQPKRNVEFWEAKFRRNVERDRAAVAALTQMGWTPITIWECELKKDRIDATMEKVIEQVRAAEPQR